MASESVDKETVSQAIVDAVETGAHTIGNSKAWARAQGVPHDVVVGCAKSLAASNVVNLAQSDVVELTLTAEGREVLEQGAPEFRLWSALPTDGSTLAKSALVSQWGGDEKKVSIAVGQAMKEKWISLTKQGSEQLYARKAEVSHCSI